MGAALVADAPDADSEIVVARHAAGAREVRVVVVFQAAVRIGGLSSAVAPRAKRLMCLRSSVDRPRRTSRLLPCNRSVGCPPLPGLTVKRARMCAIPRRMVKRPIMASARMISAQTDCRLVSCLLSGSHLEDQANAIRLPPDRGSARQAMCCPASLPSQETMHSTNHARDHRTSSQVQSERHVCQEFSASDARSFGSKYASFGMSKFGALAFSTVARTASANPVSGRSRPRWPRSRNRNGHHWPDQ